MKTVVIGTRTSALARRQGEEVAEALRESVGCEIVFRTMKTQGDNFPTQPVEQLGGKDVFTKEVDLAVLNGEIDIAIHSMKDVSISIPDGVVIGCVPERCDPRDVLVGQPLNAIGSGTVVGTGSLRRQAQLRVLCPEVRVESIRGNVPSRLRRVEQGKLDAVVLARAGMIRLGLEDQVNHIFSVDEMVPAPGQGALAVHCRKEDRDLLAMLESIHHEPTGICIAAERSFLEYIGGGCDLPAGCYARVEGSSVIVDGFLEGANGQSARLRLRCDWLHTIPMGRELARTLMEQVAALGI